MGQKTYTSNGHYLEIMTVKASALALALLLILISTHANALTPAVNSTHFVIYDLANAGQTYDQVPWVWVCGVARAAAASALLRLTSVPPSSYFVCS